MGLFSSNKDLREKVTSLENENEELKAKAESAVSLQKDNDRLSEELATANKALEAANANILEAEKAVNEANEAKAEAAKVIENQPAAVAAEAANTVASLGVDPVANTADSNNVEGEQVDEYAALNKQLESCTSPTERGVIAKKMLKIYENK